MSDIPVGAREEVVVPVVVHVRQDDHETAARAGEQYVLDALREFSPEHSLFVEHVEMENGRVVVE